MRQFFTSDEAYNDYLVLEKEVSAESLNLPDVWILFDLLGIMLGDEAWN